MLKVQTKWKGACPRHRRYNPALEGEGGIAGGCRLCTMLMNVWRSWINGWGKFDAQRLLFESAVSDPEVKAGK
jgi:hypothetical protein